MKHINDCHTAKECRDAALECGRVANEAKDLFTVFTMINLAKRYCLKALEIENG